MWPTTALTDLLGIVHPIIQAPMAGSATPELAAAVSGAGGLGSLGLGTGAPDDIRRACADLRARGAGRFNLNFFVMPALPPQAPAARDRMRALLAGFHAQAGLGPVPDPPPAPPPHGFAPDLVAALEETRPPVVSFHFGLPDGPALARIRAAGCLILCSATTVAEARALEAAGVDAIIAQGWEAGGHRGAHWPNGPGDGVGTMALVPQVVDAVRVPVIAAGGIGDGRGIAAGFALGAAGVQMGTAFLSSPEAGTDPARRALLARATDTDTMMTDAFSGRSARALRSAYAEAMADLAGRLAPYPEMYDFSGPLEAACLGQDRAFASFHLYGQAAALNRAFPAGALVELLVRDALGRMPRTSGAPGAGF
jgi:nitronate monooxygenase